MFGSSISDTKKYHRTPLSDWGYPLIKVVKRNKSEFYIFGQTFIFIIIINFIIIFNKNIQLQNPLLFYSHLRIEMVISVFAFWINISANRKSAACFVTMNKLVNISQTGNLTQCANRASENSKILTT